MFNITDLDAEVKDSSKGIGFIICDLVAPHDRNLLILKELYREHVLNEARTPILDKLVHVNLFYK